MPTGTITVYDLTVGEIVDMDPMIYHLSPLDLPFTAGIGADGALLLPVEPGTQIEFDWQDDEHLIPRSTLGAASTTGDGFIQLSAAAERLKFSTGDFLKVVKAGGSEIMRVTGYSVTTATILLVTRGYDGTTATNYAGTEVVIGLGTGLAEGSDPEDPRSSDRVANSNFMQIFGPTAIKSSGTAQVVPRYGVQNEHTYQIAKRQREQRIQVENALIYGRKTNSTTTEIRSMGGCDYYITTNVDATSTQLTVTKIQTNQQNAFDRGGVPDILMASPLSLNDLNETTDTARVRQEIVDGRRGRQPVTVVTTEFGDITVVRNRWVHKFHAFGLRRQGLARKVLRPQHMTPLAKTGDSDKVQILSEESFKCKGEEHMFKMTALSY
jgi:hypothetical protein